MASTRDSLGCPVCGLCRPIGFFSLRPDGSYDPLPRPPKLVLYRHEFAGRAKITAKHLDVPMNMALGLRANLRAALAKVEEEILAAGGELPP